MLSFINIVYTSEIFLQVNRIRIGVESQIEFCYCCITWYYKLLLINNVNNSNTYNYGFVS